MKLLVKTFYWILFKLIELLIFRLVANTEEFLTVNYDEIMLLIKNDDLFAKEEMV